MLSLLALQSVAQSPGAPDTLRSRYIKKYPDKFFIWPVLKRRELAFDLTSIRNKNDGLSFRPNSAFSFGVGAYLFDVAAELSFSIPVEEKNRGRYGTSEVRDLSTGLTGSHWSVDAFIQRYEHFYLSNPTKTPLPNEAYPLRPDIRLTNFGGNGVYVFNRNKFSLWSAYNFSERQLKSRGSGLVAWTINSVHLTADSAVLSTPYQARLSTTTNFSDVRYSTFGLAPGYSYNVVWRKLFLNVSLAMGPAHYWVYYVDSDGIPHYDISINTFVDARASLGYSSDRWFGGFTFLSQTRAVKFEEITLSTQTQSFRMVVGYRIVEKGFLKHSWKDFVPKTIRRYL